MHQHGCLLTSIILESLISFTRFTVCVCVLGHALVCRASRDVFLLRWCDSRQDVLRLSARFQEMKGRRRGVELAECCSTNRLSSHTPRQVFTPVALTFLRTAPKQPVQVLESPSTNISHPLFPFFFCVRLHVCLCIGLVKLWKVMTSHELPNRGPARPSMGHECLCDLRTEDGARTTGRQECWEAMQCC